MLSLLIVGIVALASESVATTAIVSTTYGHDAELSCKLKHHNKVIQVTWKKVTSNSTEDVATFSHRGAIVTPSFQKHVRLEAGLHKSSLLIKGVRRDDEACYRCVFYKFPHRAVGSTACLKVYELTEPVTEVRETNSPDNGILHTLACFVGHRRALNADNTVPAESSVRRIDFSSAASSVPVIEASVVGGQVLTCIARPPPVAKGKGGSSVKDELQAMRLSNGNGRLSPTLSFVIFVIGLGIA